VYLISNAEPAYMSDAAHLLLLLAAQSNTPQMYDCAILGNLIDLKVSEPESRQQP
jgi:hypothetical protein